MPLCKWEVRERGKRRVRSVIDMTRYLKDLIRQFEKGIVLSVVQCIMAQR